MRSGGVSVPFPQFCWEPIKTSPKLRSIKNKMTTFRLQEVPLTTRKGREQRDTAWGGVAMSACTTPGAGSEVPVLGRISRGQSQDRRTGSEGSPLAHGLATAEQLALEMTVASQASFSAQGHVWGRRPGARRGHSTAGDSRAPTGEGDPGARSPRAPATWCVRPEGGPAATRQSLSPRPQGQTCVVYFLAQWTCPELDRTTFPSPPAPPPCTCRRSSRCVFNLRPHF